MVIGALGALMDLAMWAVDQERGSEQGFVIIHHNQMEGVRALEVIAKVKRATATTAQVAACQT